LSVNAEMKTEFYFENAEKAKKIMKETAEKLDYRYQEMNSIAVAYKHGGEAIVKYDEKLEVYEDEAEEKIEAMED
jgi:alkylhydroperoxidase/carboxymuconolactone decarboxylase family protein YurZ